MGLKKIAKIFCSIIALAPLSFMLTSCEGTGVRFANYESYMSSGLMERLREKFDIQFLTYESNETLEIKFSRSYDIAIPSTYEVINLLKLNKLEKLDWGKFNLEYINGTTREKIIDSEQFKNNILSVDAQTLINAIDKKYKDDLEIKKIIGDDIFHILDWGIPYFMQSFIFGYKGNSPIESLKDKEATYSINDILSAAKNEERFSTSIGKGKMGITDDYRTIYGASKLINNDNVNPENEKIDGEINNIKQVYSGFTDNFKSGQCNLNSDAGMLVSTFVDPKGMNGLFAYNGDMLYAATGAEIVDPFTSNNFFVPKLDKALLAFDMIVINTGQSKKKQKQIYDIVRAGFLDGLDCETGSGQDDEHHIWDYDDKKQEYIYGPMENFDYVMYTSPYKKINDYVINGDYFEGDIETTEMMKKIYTIKTTNKSIDYLEDPLTNLTKSNMVIAWRAMRDRL